jgi:small GTP-binding protein
MSSFKENENENQNEKDNNLDFSYQILPSDYNESDINFKIIIIGDSNVGKSCLTYRAVKNVYIENNTSTIGFDFYTFFLLLNNQRIQLQIWDTCGQEMYKSLVYNFYKNSSLAFLVYSITSKESFDNLQYWIRELKNQTSVGSKIFLIGNKSDLEDKRQVSHELAKKFKEDECLDFFMETSAKTGYNSQAIFVEAAKILYKEYLFYKDKTNNSFSYVSFENPKLNNAKLKLPKPKNKANHVGCC